MQGGPDPKLIRYGLLIVPKFSLARLGPKIIVDQGNFQIKIRIMSFLTKQNNIFKTSISTLIDRSMEI
jgi:hypothetical protein